MKMEDGRAGRGEETGRRSAPEDFTKGFAQQGFSRGKSALHPGGSIIQYSYVLVFCFSLLAPVW